MSLLFFLPQSLNEAVVGVVRNSMFDTYSGKQNNASKVLTKYPYQCDESELIPESY
jgi:hypothetical protein